MRKLNDLEDDLLESRYIKQKVREDDVYAQNLYAALCNMQWVKDDSVQAWHCSWRYAGSLVAQMNGERDYLDWYLSTTLFSKDGYINEGALKDNIVEDLKLLGWNPLPWEKSQEQERLEIQNGMPKKP